MFGLMVGMSIFSAMAMQNARHELDLLQKRQAAKAKAQAEDLAKGLEFAVLTETRETYSDDYNLERARANTSGSGGKTRGGQDVLVTQRETEGESLGDKTRRVAITASDDTLLRSQVHLSQSAEDLSQLKPSEQLPVVVFDTNSVRERQVRTSKQNMEAMAEHVYAFYAAKLRMPSKDEFENISSKLGFRDVWGTPFTYTYGSETTATLEFTTPWNYTQSLRLSLKDDEPGTTEQNP